MLEYRIAMVPARGLLCTWICKPDDMDPEDMDPEDMDPEDMDPEDMDPDGRTACA